MDGVLRQSQTLRLVKVLELAKDELEAIEDGRVNLTYVRHTLRQIRIAIREARS